MSAGITLAHAPAAPLHRSTPSSPGRRPLLIPFYPFLPTPCQSQRISDRSVGMRISVLLFSFIATAFVSLAEAEESTQPTPLQDPSTIAFWRLRWISPSSITPKAFRRQAKVRKMASSRACMFFTAGKRARPPITSTWASNTRPAVRNTTALLNLAMALPNLATNL